YVVGDRAGVEGFQKPKRRLSIEHLGLAGIFQSKPDLLAVRSRRDVRTERTGLRNLADNLVIGDSYYFGLRCKRGADVAVFAVGREDRHARTVRYSDPLLFLVSRSFQYRAGVLGADVHPTLHARSRIEALVRR